MPHMGLRKAVRRFKAKRTYSLRSDASVGSGQERIEKVFGLPKGSVRLLLRSGRAARRDKSIGNLLADWHS